MNRVLKKQTHEDLEEIFREAESCDKDPFAKAKANVILVSGDHYASKNSRLHRDIRQNSELTENQKIRLVRNHSQRVHGYYVNHILSQAPWVTPTPKNKKELQDQKSAELNKAVWDDAGERLNVREMVEDWASDYVIGEVITKMFWDPNAGYIKSYQQQVDEYGTPLFDDVGKPLPDETKPVMSGDIVFEDVYMFNLLRSPNAKTLKKSPYLIIRKMMDIEEAVSVFPDKKQYIEESMDDTFIVFDAQKGNYRYSKKEVLIKEIYYRKCKLYPKGYFYIYTSKGILAEGELPGGIFPIVVQPFKTFQTLPRGHGPLEVFKPFQVELNRMASKISEHQITLGDDKILHPSGSKVTTSHQFPGIRGYAYTGGAPTYLPGRSGEQYLGTYNSTLAEGLAAVNASDLMAEEDSNAATDPYALLFKSAKQKVKMKTYVNGFERFLKAVCKTYLELAKVHMPEDNFIQAVGKTEAINIPEFKNSNELCYSINIEPQSEDIETKYGRQLVMNHILQYTGNKLEKEDIGMLVRQMPYANVDEALSDFTINYDIATNLILALDRGQNIPPHEDDPHEYLVKRLSARMAMADFMYLPEEIQGMYKDRRDAHSTMVAMKAQQLAAIEADFIPSGGYLVPCDFYVPKPNDPTQTQKLKISSEAIQWLVTRLKQQGSLFNELESAGPAVQSAVGNAYLSQQNPQAAGMESPAQAGVTEGAINGPSGIIGS